MDALQRLSVEEFKNRDKLPLVLILDNVRSGLNVGSIFRTADAFAIQKIYLCGITAQPPHREILKTALGSTESVDWEYAENNIEAITQLKSSGYTIIAVEQTNEKTWLHEFQPLEDKQYALVLGNEVDGVDSTVLEHCDVVIEIPQYGTKHSLNVAVAAGIVVWDFQQKMLR